MKRPTSQLSRFLIVAISLIPLFIGISLKASQWLDAHHMDFALYWQAGHMNLHGQYVYNHEQWLQNIIRPGLDLWFHYPLPLAILLTPLGLLSINTAFILWIILSQCAILFSVFIAFGFYKERSPLFEIIGITGILLFRPVYIIVLSGQIGSFLLLFASLALYFSKQNRWFLSGLILSLVALKPSYGIIILALMGLWMLRSNKWFGLAGMASGSFLLLIVGMMKNPNWVMDYLAIGQEVFSKYHEIQTTIWGVSSLIIKNNGWDSVLGIFAVLCILSVEIYFLLNKKTCPDAFSAMAIIMPVALLAALYSWSYDQILLIISLIYVSIKVSRQWGNLRSALFLLGIDAAAIALVAVAYSQKHDIWSTLLSIFIWIITLFFIGDSKKPPYAGGLDERTSIKQLQKING